MASARRLSLLSQISAVDQWAGRHRIGFKGRSSEADLHAEHIAGVRATLAWLHNHEAEIRAFLALPPAVRTAILAHGSTATEMAVQQSKREAIARAGGPVR